MARLHRAKRWPGCWALRLTRWRTAPSNSAPCSSIDQFEELFTLAEADEAQAFLDVLGELMGRPNLYILLTVRADFYPELMACSLWQPIRANRLELTPLGDDELWAAIVEPAGRVGVTVDEALAVRLIADAAGERGALPLVQETLVLLWEKVKERQLGLAAYRGMAEGGRSGLQVAIDRRASSVYNNLPAAAQLLARRIFLRLIQFGEGRADTRRQQTVAELRASGDNPALFDQTLARLIDSRLLTASGEADDPDRRLDIAHEALIAGWPRLQAWLGQRRAAEQNRRRLEGKAAEWVQAEKQGGLLDEYELQEAETWLAAEDAQELGCSHDLNELVVASKAAITQAADEKEAQWRRELEQTQKLTEEQRLRAEEAERATAKQSKLTRIAFVVGAVALMLAIVAGIAGCWARNSAKEAEAARATAQAEATRADEKAAEAIDAEAAAVAEAERAEEEARRALGSRAEALAYQVPAKGSEALLSAVKAIGPYFESNDPIPPEIVAGLTAAVAAGRRSIPLQISGERIAFARLSFDDELVFTASEKGNLHIWDRHDGHQLVQLERVDGAITEVAFSPATNLVAAAMERGGALWNSLSGELIYTYEGTIADPAGFAVEELVVKLAVGKLPILAEEKRIIHAALSSDMKLILTSVEDGTLQLWDRNSGQLVRQFDNISPSIEQIAFSPAGGYVGALIEDRTALWELASGKLAVAPGEDLGNDIERREVAELLQQGLKQGKAGCDSPSSLSSIEDRSLLASRCQPNSEVFVLASSESPYKSELEIYNNNGDLVSNLVGHQWRVEIASFSGDGSRLATSGEDRNILVWEEDPKTRDWRAVTTLAGHESGVRYLSLSRDGRLLLSVDDAGEARIWDLEASQSLRSVTTPHGVAFARFAKNSNYFVTAAKYTAYSWDVATGQWMWRTIRASSLDPVISPDGKQVLIAGQGGRIRVVDTVTGEFIRSIDTEMESLNSIEFSPKGDSLLTIGGQGNAMIWDLDDAQPQASFLLPASGFPWTEYAAFAPNGRTIAIANRWSNGMVWLWNTETESFEHELQNNWAAWPTHVFAR